MSDDSSRSYHARIAGLAAALTLGLASSAWASGGEGYDGGEGGEGDVGASAIGNSESIDLQGRIPPQCSFTQSSNATNLGALVANASPDRSLHVPFTPPASPPLQGLTKGT